MKKKKKKDNNLYKISEVAQLLSITTRTIRYYEQENLLGEVVRTGGGMRLYTDSDIKRIKEIKEMQKTKALSLEQIRERLTSVSEKMIDKNENIAIVTDSTASLPPVALEGLDIFVIPITIIINKKSYKDGIDIKPIEFFEMFKGENHRATTTPPSVKDIAALYKSLLKKRFTRIISIHISGAWSNTLDNAKLAAKKTGSVDIVDSLNTGLGLGLQVYSAALRAKEKKKVSCILDELQEKRKRCWQMIYVNSLDYFMPGGEKGSSIHHELLSVLLDFKPLLFYNPEYARFSIYDRPDGTEDSLKKMLRSIKDYERQFGRGFTHIGITHTYMYKEAFDLMKMIKAAYPYVNIIISEASTAINTYVGFYSLSMSIY